MRNNVIFLYTAKCADLKEDNIEYDNNVIDMIIFHRNLQQKLHFVADISENSAEINLPLSGTDE
jgi:hypothetical protein